MLKSFMKIFTKDESLMRVQSNVAAAIEQVIRRDILDYVYLEAHVTTIPTAFEHKLGRQPQGWIVVDKNSTGDIWATAKDSKTITLDASATIDVKILIY